MFIVRSIESFYLEHEKILVGCDKKSFFVFKPWSARTLRLLFKSLQSKNTTQFPLSYPICSTNMDAEIRCSCDNTKNRSACWVTAMYVQSYGNGNDEDCMKPA